MRLYESKKLHYNKYLYKISIPNQCASFFRTEFQKEGTLSYAKKKLDECNRYHSHNKSTIQVPWGSKFRDTIAVDHYYDAITIYRHLVKKQYDFLIRIEINRLNVYCNERKFLVGLYNKLRNNYVEFHEPDPLNVGFLLENKNTILVDKPPQYEYKITLGKKLGQPALAKWIDNNPHLGKMGDTAKQSCYNNGYVKGYYFYVRDKKTLFLVQMLIGDNIQRIEQLVYTDK